MARQEGNGAKLREYGDTPQARPAVRHPTEQLLASRALSGFQPDFARAILTGPEYTVEEALDALNKFFKGGGK